MSLTSPAIELAVALEHARYQERYELRYMLEDWKKEPRAPIYAKLADALLPLVLD
jgi:hypothetical protein